MVVNIRTKSHEDRQERPKVVMPPAAHDNGAWAEQIAVEDLLTGHEGGREYARPIEDDWVNDLIARWDDNKLDVLHVSFDPEARLVVICGNHRLTAARKKHGPKYKFWCMVYAGLTLKEEALKFHAIDQERKRHTARDGYRSAIVFEDPKTLAIDAVLKRYGVSVNDDPGPRPNRIVGKIRAIRSLYTAYDYDGAATFEEAVRTLLDAWGTNGEPNNQPTINAQTIDAMVGFLWRYGDLTQFDRTKLVRAMQMQDRDTYGLRKYLDDIMTLRRKHQREYGKSGNATMRFGMEVLATKYNRYVRRYPNLRLPERWAALSRNVVRVEKRAYLDEGLVGEPPETDL